MRCIFKKYMFKIIRVNNLKYFVISFRSVFFYIIVVCVYKIMGKREIGELSVIDLIVSLFIAELVAISIENYKESLFISLIPIIILVFLQCITSRISLKNKKVRDTKYISYFLLFSYFFISSKYSFFPYPQAQY